jgi:hypothetical protein
LVYTFRPRPAGTRDGLAKVPVVLLGRVCPAAVGLYGVLRSFDGRGGVCPRVNTIAERAGICHTQAKDYLRILREAGTIEVQGRVDDHNRATSNLYHFPDLSERTYVVVDQDHAARGLVTNPAGGWCQIPPRDGDKFRPQTRTINQDTELEVVGWSAPLARVNSEELHSEDQARQLISKACRDEYWSRQIRSLFDLSNHWDQIAEEFSNRPVRDIGAARAAKRRKDRADKRVAKRTPEGTARQGIGGFSLSNL